MSFEQEEEDYSSEQFQSSPQFVMVDAEPIPSPYSGHYRLIPILPQPQIRVPFPHTYTEIPWIQEPPSMNTQSSDADLVRLLGTLDDQDLTQAPPSQPQEEEEEPVFVASSSPLLQTNLSDTLIAEIQSGLYDDDLLEIERTIQERRRYLSFLQNTTLPITMHTGQEEETPVSSRRVPLNDEEDMEEVL
jgi:hypothetical protein